MCHDHKHTVRNLVGDTKLNDVFVCHSKEVRYNMEEKILNPMGQKCLTLETLGDRCYIFIRFTVTYN